MLRRTLLALALVVPLVAAPAAQAAPRDRFGVDVANPLEVSTEVLVRDLRDAQRSGASVVRYELLWSVIEPARGRLDPAALTRLDAAFREAARRKIRVVGLFIGTPCWASVTPRAGGGCYSDPIRDPSSAVGAATALAQRYQANLAGFEIWNEPDHRNEKYWAGPDKINRYVALTKALYAPLKQAAPSVPVLAGAFVGSDGRWLKALYEAGIKGHYDALAVHFYDLTLAGLRTTRAVQTQHGDTTPMWIGETGWSSCRSRARKQDGHVCVTRAAQASSSVDLVRALRRTPWVAGVLFYTVRDDATYDFGFFDRRGRAKPVARALRAELRARTTRKTRRVRLRLRRAGGKLIVSGTAPAGDVLTVEAVAPRVRFRAITRLTPSGRLSIALPPQLGTRGVTVRVRHPWSGATGTARR